MRSPWLQDYPSPSTLAPTIARHGTAADGVVRSADGADLVLMNLVTHDNAARSTAGVLHLRHAGGMVQNVVMDHASAPRGSAMAMRDSPDLAVANAVDSWNSDGSAVFSERGVPRSWAWNDTWLNSEGDFGGMMSDPKGQDGNMAADPRFSTEDDDSLLSISGRKNAGDPAVLSADWTRSDLGAFGGPEGVW